MVRRKKGQQLMCTKPDRDAPRLTCGYPLPCPWHTATIHADKEPPTVEEPTTSRVSGSARHRLKQVAEALTKRAAHD